MRYRPSSPAEWNDFFLERKRRADNDLVEAFFFKLDAASEPGLMEVNPAMTPAERLERRAGWEEIAASFEIRIEQRFNGGHPTLPINPKVVEVFSKIVVEAANALPATSPFATVITDFGSGVLADNVQVPSASSKLVITVRDADSYFLWFFAEFGLLALELDIDKAFWKSAIKPLIHSAFLFCKRFPSGMPIQLFNYPGPRLEPKPRTTADRAFAQIWKEAKGDPARAMSMALRESGSSFRA